MALKMERTAAGRSFLQKFASSRDMGKAFGEELGALIIVDMLQRFVAKAEANEPT
jgi:hypothetical protein